MPNTAMGTVDMLGIYAVQLTHPFRQIGIGCLDQQVIVIGHQTIGMADPPEALAGHGQDSHERRPVVVHIAEEDAAPLVVPRRDVVERTGEFQP